MRSKQVFPLFILLLSVSNVALNPLAHANTNAAAPKPAENESTASAWQSIFTEAGRRMEVDRNSIKNDAGKVQAWGRIILDRAIPDTMSGSGYRILEALNRYDCTARTFTTLKRVYRKDEKEVLREENTKSQVELPVRTGTLDDKVLRIACKPSGDEVRKQFDATVKQAKALTEHAAPPTTKKELLRTDVAEHKPALAPHSEPSGSHAGPRPLVRVKRATAATTHDIEPATHTENHVHWSYEGAGAPNAWAALLPEYKLCGTGKRQSPIDIRDGIKVDLAPIDFGYRPSQFRIIDNGHTVQVEVGENRITLLGKNYELIQFHFHRPSEERINGRGFDMVVHLVHRSEDNKLAVVAVMLEKGSEHALVQTLWNHLPLERNESASPPGVPIDLTQILPEKKDYFTYMGSLTTPPCSEGVLWLVMKNPVQISAEQISIFARLYRNNARPVQNAAGRLIKENR